MGNGDWLKQTFPKLIEVEFVDVNMVNVLDGKTLIEFVNRNPQLQRLTVIYNDEFRFSFTRDRINTSRKLMLAIFSTYSQITQYYLLHYDVDDTMHLLMLVINLVGFLIIFRKYSN